MIFIKYHTAKMPIKIIYPISNMVEFMRDYHVQDYEDLHELYKIIIEYPYEPLMFYYIDCDMYAAYQAYYHDRGYYNRHAIPYFYTLLTHEKKILTEEQLRNKVRLLSDMNIDRLDLKCYESV